MPKILEDCVKKKIAQGMSEDSAWAICIAALRDAGLIKRQGDKWVLTEKGRKRSRSRS